jgi:PAS domain S-box-containing protein
LVLNVACVETINAFKIDDLMSNYNYKYKYQKIISLIIIKDWRSFAFLVVGIIITVFAAIYTKRNKDDQLNNEFILVCNEIKTKINTRLHSHAQLLRSGSSYFAASDTVTRKDWKTFNDNLKLEVNLPGIQGLGFSILIKKEQLQQHIQKIKNEGFSNYKVIPDAEREVYTSVIFLEPFDFRNRRAFGYDMFSEPIRRKAMEQACDYNVAALSGKVFLLQETEKDLQAGTLMYVPVFKKGMPTNTLNERRAAIIGWEYSPYRMRDLMHGILGRWDLNDESKIHLQVYDNDIISQNSLLFDSQSKDTLMHSDIPGRTLRIPIVFNNKKWTLQFSQSNGQFSYFFSRCLFVAISGLTISLLLFLLSHSLFNTQVKAQKIAQKLTMKLKESEKNFTLLFNIYPDIVNIVRLSDNKIVIVNNSFINQLGYTIDEVIGKTTTELNIWANPAERQLIFDEIFEKGYSTNFETLLQRKDGTKFTGIISAKLFDIDGVSHVLSVTRDISDRKKIEQDLKTSEAKFRLLFDTMTEGVALNEMVFDEQGEMVDYRILEVNKYFYQTADYKGKQVVNRLATQIYGMSNEQITTFWNKHKEKNETAYTEMLSPLNSKWFYISTSPFINNTFVTVFFDITERKRIEENLVLSEYSLSKAQEVSHVGSWLWNIKTNELKWSDEMYRIFDIDKESFTGMLTDVIEKSIHPDDRQKVDESNQSVSEKGVTIPLEYRVVWADGTIKSVWAEAGELINDETGKPYILTGIVQDITARKQVEFKIKQQNDELKKLNADKNRFITILGHDLKSPFNTILGFLGLLEKNIRKYDVDKIEKQISIVNQSAKNTFNLLDDILIWVKANSGKIPYEPQKLNFEAICREIVENLGLTASNKDITINYSSSDIVTIFADKNMVNTILRNLVSNSIKYTNMGGNINIYAEKSDSNAIITVSDNGVGIDPDNLNKLFEISQKVTTDGTANEKGTGLGLLLCKEFVEKHGGEIWVESEVGKGSKFKFTMPLCKD